MSKKCVQRINNESEITNINSLQAESLVSAGSHRYVARKLWKEKIRGSVKQSTPKQKPAEDNILQKING